MNKIAPEQLLKINCALCEKIGLPPTEKANIALLGEIAEAPYEKDVQLFYVFPDTLSKASKLACEIEAKKPFDALNRATAIVSIITLLQVNDIKLTSDLCTDPTVSELIAAKKPEALEGYLRPLIDNKYLQAMLTDT